MRCVRWLCALLLAAAAGGSLRAQEPPAHGAVATPQGILVDFQDAELRTIIAALAEAARLNVVFAELPARRVTIRVRQPVSPDSVRALLRSIAEANGVTVTETGGLMRFDVVSRAEPTTAAPRAAVAPGEQGLFVYRLRHARAVRLASTLGAVFGGAVVQSTDDVAAPLSRRLREQQIPPLFLDTLGRAAAGAPGPAEARLPGRMQSDVQIVPDENTNSLLVRATAADWEIIRRAIEAVDLRPLQVLIEVLIAEVRRTSDLQVGVSGSASKRAAGQTTPRQSGELAGDSSDPIAGELLLKWMNGGSVDIQVALRALATRGGVHILSRPVLLAQNNQEARILIGSQRPFVQVFRSLPTETGVRDQIVQYRDVGTSLTIVPTVNADGYVNLQLTQEVSNATNETQFGAPVISTREAQTYLFVRDGQTTVIGGLIDRQTERNRSGIPVLIRIPVLGALFGSTDNSTTHSELFLFLTPHVVRSDEELDRVRDSVQRHLELLERELPKAPPIGPPAAPDTVPRAGRPEAP